MHLFNFIRCSVSDDVKWPFTNQRNTCVRLCHHQLTRRGGYLRTVNVYKCIHTVKVICYRLDSLRVNYKRLTRWRCSGTRTDMHDARRALQTLGYCLVTENWLCLVGGWWCRPTATQLSRWSAASMRDVAVISI